MKHITSRVVCPAAALPLLLPLPFYPSPSFPDSLLFPHFNFYTSLFLSSRAGKMREEGRRGEDGVLHF